MCIGPPVSIRGKGTQNYFVHIHIFSFTDLQPYLPLFLKKNYIALLTESFHMSATYLKMCTQKITDLKTFEVVLRNYIGGSFVY